MFAHDKHFQSKLAYVGKARAYQSEAPFWLYTLAWPTGFIHKHSTRLARDKLSSLLRTLVNYRCPEILREVSAQLPFIMSC